MNFFNALILHIYSHLLFKYPVNYGTRTTLCAKFILSKLASIVPLFIQRIGDTDISVSAYIFPFGSGYIYNHLIRKCSTFPFLYHISLVG